MFQKTKIALTVWIDEISKVISVKTVPEAKQISFEDWKTGIQKITELVSKGYKIG